MMNIQNPEALLNSPTFLTFSCLGFVKYYIKKELGKRSTHSHLTRQKVPLLAIL